MIAMLVSKGMTVCEAKVIEKVLEGKSNDQIAAELSISTKTVKFHCTKSFSKFGVNSRAQLMAKFMIVNPALFPEKLVFGESETGQELVRGTVRLKTITQ